MTTQAFDKLVALLKELFQLDQPDLDFGVYRVIHARSSEISRFLEHDLLPQVRTALEQFQPADKKTIERELTEAIQQGKALGADPEALPKVKALRARLETEVVDHDKVEGEVYDHLYGFFRRYYDEGDFLSRRVYKAGVYAIPYEGEETRLHWANADQYYIKTSEYLKDYAFRIRPEDPSRPMRVHFRLIDAVEGEHDNVQEAEGKERRFRLVGDAGISLKNGELFISFTYGPDPQRQKDLNAAAEQEILASSEPSLLEWMRELARKHLRSDGTESDATRLRVHLDRYTARNTFDYFIHKDLGSFLRRELDFYIKNDVMQLDDIASATAPRVDEYLSKIKVIRGIADKIIAFLAQLEDFQRGLWRKKKFVVATTHCVRVDCIPEALHKEIISNPAQREEWVTLCKIDQLEDYSAPLIPAFLRQHSSLMVDTRHFPPAFADRLLAALPNYDALLDGVMVHGENYQALSLIEARYREAVDCIYIDPPYNSKTSEIAYKNTYKHSSWLSLMQDRLALSSLLAADNGSHIVAIDENEQENLGQLLSLTFPNSEKVCVAIVHNKKGIQGDYFSYSHEYAFFCIPPGLPATHGSPVVEEDWDFANLRKWGRESERSTARNCFYPIVVKAGQIVSFGDVSPEDFHPTAANVRKAGGEVWIYPVDSKGTERKWRYARNSVESILPLLKVHAVESGEIQILKAMAEKPVKTMWDDSRYIAGDYGTKWLTDLGLKVRDDLYPKSVHTVEDSVFAVSDTDALVLDYFAGSGTTGHAVINLNRKDAGRRKFILAEIGDHFDSVLVPRLKKVTYTPEWKEGRPRRAATTEEVERSPRMLKVIRLESYEDTLNNLAIQGGEPQRRVLELPLARAPGGLSEQYVLRYFLDVESRGSASLLDIGALSDPTAYRLTVRIRGSDESREVQVDLIETFNWLLGLSVREASEPQAVSTSFARDGQGRLGLSGGIRADPRGPWWFRPVAGTAPDGRKALVIWRKRPGGDSAGGVEEDNLVLEAWFKERYGGRKVPFDVIYVNGSTNLESLKGPAETWTTRLIEEDFQRLMFEKDGR